MLITHVTLSEKVSEKGTGPFLVVKSRVLSSFRTPFRTKRHGIVLLVVMAMLALFATVALSFVFYAEAEATASRYASQAQTQAQADVDPELLLSYYLSQLIYDTDNIYSAMRGHSLARNMYGYNPADLNAIPYNGMGRLRFDVPHALLDGKPAAPEPAAKNNMLLINYQNFYGNQGGTLRDPEKDAQGNYVGGNVHWTYPDLNNMFLAAVAGGGDVLMPSFHRPWMGVAFGPNSQRSLGQVHDSAAPRLLPRSVLLSGLGRSGRRQEPGVGPGHPHRRQGLCQQRQHLDGPRLPGADRAQRQTLQAHVRRSHC